MAEFFNIYQDWSILLEFFFIIIKHINIQSALTTGWNNIIF